MCDLCNLRKHAHIGQQVYIKFSLHWKVHLLSHLLVFIICSTLPSFQHESWLKDWFTIVNTALGAVSFDTVETFTFCVADLFWISVIQRRWRKYCERKGLSNKRMLVWKREGKSKHWWNFHSVPKYNCSRDINECSFNVSGVK